MKIAIFDMNYIYHCAMSYGTDNVANNFVSIIDKEIAIEKPTHVLVSNSDLSSNWRKSVVTNYVSSKSKLSISDIQIYKDIILLLEEKGIVVAAHYNMESADVIASVCEKLKGKGDISIVIYSSDLKTLSLISPDIEIKNPITGKIKNHEWVSGKFGSEASVKAYYAVNGAKSLGLPSVLITPERKESNLYADLAAEFTHNGSLNNFFKTEGEAKVAAKNFMALTLVTNLQLGFNASRMSINS